MGGERASTRRIIRARARGCVCVFVCARVCNGETRKPPRAACGPGGPAAAGRGRRACTQPWRWRAPTVERGCCAVGRYTCPPRTPPRMPSAQYPRHARPARERESAQRRIGGEGAGIQRRAAKDATAGRRGRGRAEGRGLAGGHPRRGSSRAAWVALLRARARTHTHTHTIAHAHTRTQAHARTHSRTHARTHPRGGHLDVGQAVRPCARAHTHPPTHRHLDVGHSHTGTSTWVRPCGLGRRRGSW